MDEKHHNASARLTELGYESSLPRRLSFFSILGLSFAIMAVPYGLSTTMSYGLINGGPVTILYGWVFLTLISTSIAASLAEICSAFPTAGGVYYWSAILAEPKYAKVVSYINGWLGLMGNVLVTVSICFGGGGLILSAIGLWNEEFAPSPWQVVLTFWAVLLIAVLVNIFLVKYLDLLNTFCVYWTGASVLIILITVLVMARTGRRDADFVFSGFDDSRAGWAAPGWSFFVGLLQSAYTLTGYGMVASMCEETSKPDTEVPRAMVQSVILAGITGLVFLIPILFVLPDVDLLLSVKTGQPIATIFKSATGSAGGGFGLLFLILGILFFAAVGSMTASSRTLFAFSRDKAVPGHNLWSRITHGVPIWALLINCLIMALLGLIYLGSAAAFNAFVGAATICIVPTSSTNTRSFHVLCDSCSASTHSRSSLNLLGTL